MFHRYLKIVGVGLVLFGLLVPANGLFAALQGAVETGFAEKMPGLMAFKYSIAALGLYSIFLGWIARPTEKAIPRQYFEQSSHQSNLIFFALILIATVLRVVHLDSELWFDEMLTHVNYMSLSVGQIFSTFEDANNHVFYSIIARVSLGLFGDHEWAFRLPAALFGVASIWALYGVSRRFLPVATCLLIVGLCAVSYHHIWFSQNARGYTALLFFSIWASSIAVDATRASDARKWVAYAFVAFLGAWTHLSIAFLIVAHFAYFAWVSFGKPKRDFVDGLLFGFVLLTALTLTGYSIVIPDMLGGALLGSGLQAHSEWTNPIWAIAELFRALQSGFAGPGVAIAGGLFVLVALFDLLRKRAAAIVVFLVVPTTLAVLLLASIGYTLFPRFFFFGMGFGIIVAVHGAVVIGAWLFKFFGQGRARLMPLMYVPAAILILASAATLLKVYNPKQQYRAAIEFLEQGAQSTDQIAVLGIADFPMNAYYSKGWPQIKSLADLNKVLPESGDIWVVHTLPVHARTAYPEIMMALEQDFIHERSYYGTLGGGAVVIHRASAEKINAAD